MTNWRAPELAEVAPRSLKWLKEALEELSSRHLPQLLQASALAALCADIEPELTEEAARTCEIVRAKAKESDDSQIYACNGASILLYCVVEQQLLGEVSPRFRDYADQSAQVIRDLPASEREGHFHAPRLLLSRLGMYSEPLFTTTPLSVDLACLISGELRQTQEVVRRIESLTLYGTVPPECPVGLDSVLESIMMIELRRYNLEPASAILRALAYLGRKGGLAWRTARHFLLAQQRADGSFGFYDEEADYLAAQTSDQLSPLKFQLAVTLACLWSLAETGLEDYRLYRDVGTLGPVKARLRVMGSARPRNPTEVNRGVSHGQP